MRIVRAAPADQPMACWKSDTQRFISRTLLGKRLERLIFLKTEITQVK